MQDNGQAALTLELIQDPKIKSRFAAWWKCQYGSTATPNKSDLPPNVHLLARYVVLQLDFPKLDGGGDHHVDLAVTVSIFAYLKLDTDVDGQRVLKLANWDIQSSPNNDPLDPNDPLWGHLKPGCEKEELALRLALRDALIIATEILLANVSKNLVQSIPLPPINVVSNLNLVPERLVHRGA